MVLIDKKACIGLCLLILASCSRNTEDWTVARVHSGSKQFSSSKLSCYTNDWTNGIDVELLATHEECHMYLNVHSRPVKPYKGDPKKALVHVLIGDEKWAELAYRHEGGQRLLVSETMRDRIIEALLDGTPLIIKVPGYSTTLDPEEFLQKYAEFQHAPFFKNPFRSPL